MAAERRRPGVAAGRRSGPRRRLGQNDLASAAGERIVAEAGFAAGDLVVEIGAGLGALTRALARRRLETLAFEIDARRVRRLRAGLAHAPSVRVVEVDFLRARLPARPFRVIGSLPFGRTTDMLHRLLDDPALPLLRADVIVQWEVAAKRAAVPPTTLLGTAWAPWWEFRLGRRIAAAEFVPVPKVDAALLTIMRREPPLLPTDLARAFAGFVRAHWPFARGRTMVPPGP